MKLYLTSVGEKTTEVAKWQAERLGFEVVLLDKVEPWIDKYKRFIDMAQGEDCLRMDADVILNKNIKQFILPDEKILIAQFHTFDFYKNDVSITSPVWYSKKSLKIIKDNLGKLDINRPEASAWRLENINDYTYTSYMVVGMHGFFQDKETIDRAIKNKTERKQIEEYDFWLVDKIMRLYE